jgi:HEAT repeat protein
MNMFRSIPIVLTVLASGLLLTGCASEVDHLGRQLQNPDVMVRWDAVERLAETQDPDAVELLMEALAAPEPEIHWAAADALVKFRLMAAPVLAEGLRNPNVQVQILSAFALGEIGDVRSSSCLAGALSHDKHTQVRLEAAAALGKLGGETALNALMTAVEAEQDAEVRKTVEASLENAKRNTPAPQEETEQPAE